MVNCSTQRCVNTAHATGRLFHSQWLCEAGQSLSPPYYTVMCPTILERPKSNPAVFKKYWVIVVAADLSQLTNIGIGQVFCVQNNRVLDTHQPAG